MTLVRSIAHHYVIALLCFVLGHDDRLLRVVNGAVRQCRRCGDTSRVLR